MEHLLSDERAIICKLVETALASGLLVAVHDGEEWACGPQSDAATVFAHVGHTCTTLLVLREVAQDRDGNGVAVGRVLLVHGNGPDVVADYSDNPATASVVAPAMAFAEALL